MIGEILALDIYFTTVDENVKFNCILPKQIFSQKLVEMLRIWVTENANFTLWPGNCQQRKHIEMRIEKQLFHCIVYV